MRILHVVARSHVRGAEKVAMELCEELDALGHENRIVALGLAHDGGRHPELTPLVARVSVGPDVLVVSAFRLRRLLRSHPADVVLAHGGWAVQVAVAAMTPRRRGQLLIWQRILGLPEEVWHPVRRRWWRVVVKAIDAAVALTPALEKEVRRMGFDGPVWVIPNSRRPDRFRSIDRAEVGRQLRDEIGVDRDLALLGFVGHLVAQKRPERAVEVLARVLATGQEAHLVLTGDGPLRPEVERAVISFGVTGHVTLLGHRPDVERVLGGIDLLLLTSDVEGIPGVAIEAQMAGCPVITFPLGGVGEVVEDGVTGVVLDRADASLMADRVVDLLSQPAVMASMGTEARRRTPEFAASRTAAMYEARMAELQGEVRGDAAVPMYRPR